MVSIHFYCREQIDIWLGFGIDDILFTFIDSGKKRTTGDAFAAAGVKNYNETANAVRWIMNYDTNSPGNRATHNSTAQYAYYISLSHEDRNLLGRYVESAIKARVTAPAIPTAPLAAYMYLANINGRIAEVLDFERALKNPKKGGHRQINTKIGKSKANGARVRDTVINAWLTQAILKRKVDWNEGKPYPFF